MAVPAEVINQFQQRFYKAVSAEIIQQFQQRFYRSFSRGYTAVSAEVLYSRDSAEVL